MWKAIAISLFVFAVFLGLLVFLQPSPQEAALGNLSAAQKILDGVKSSGATSKLDEARKAVSSLDLKRPTKTDIDKAVSAIDDARTDLESDRARLDANVAELRAQLDQAGKNLSAPTAAERAKGIKDQILLLLWPLVVAFVVFYLLNSQSAVGFFKQFAALVSRVKIPGALEIQFAETVKNTQEEVLRGYRQQVISSYDAVAAQYKVSETVGRLVDGLITNSFGGKPPKGFRCTVHVQDLLFQHSLYQLIDYQPRRLLGPKRTRGRAWSVRRGLLGQSWRLEENRSESTLPKDSKDLINDWAMTRDEAESSSVSARQTSLCYLIKGKNESPVAALYMDAEEQKAFGEQAGIDALMKAIGEGVKHYGLDDAFDQIWRQVQSSAPLIEIYGANA
jgi:hypothetical protein